MKVRWSTCWQRGLDMDRPGPTCTWYWRMPLEHALTELWLAKGDLSQARPQAERFLKMVLADSRITSYQPLPVRMCRMSLQPSIQKVPANAAPTARAH